jgi:class 3 adenylate cyclase
MMTGEQGVFDASPYWAGTTLAREQRELAAILPADVVDYSRLMGRDESGTLARLRTNRVERLDPVRSKYGSRPVNLAGDAISSVPLRPGRLKI